MAGLRRNNHYVPKLYLKQWIRNEHILTYRLLVPQKNYPKWKRHSPTSIACQKHLYTYWATHGETDQIEKWLHTNFENPVVEALSLAVQEAQMRPEHWDKLFRFAVAQDVRTIRFLKELKERASRYSNDIEKIIENSIDNLNRNPEALKHDIKKENDFPLPFTTKIIRADNNGALVQVKSNSERARWLWTINHHLTDTIQKIRSHRWTILKSPKGVIWPTSDSPVIRLNFMSRDNYNFNGGWGQENCEIMLPLSPKHLLYTRVGHKPPPRNTILREYEAEQIKKYIIENAYRYIFSIEPDNIDLVRTRIENIDSFRKEQIWWAKWRERQLAAEKYILNG